MPYLIVQVPSQTDDKLALAGREITVGRLDDNEPRIDEESVSRHHAVIRPNGDGYVLVDGPRQPQRHLG
jgi:pSer/pThr/pTyr-binding forkhead associated (FHA) protein